MFFSHSNAIPDDLAVLDFETLQWSIKLYDYNFNFQVKVGLICL